MKKTWNYSDENNSQDFSKCTLESYDTYTSLLSDDNFLSREAMDDKDLELNQEIFEKGKDIKHTPINEFANFKRVHTNAFDKIEDLNLYGVVIVVQDDVHSLVLDGNHRINSCEKFGVDTLVPTIFVTGYIPLMD